MSPGPRRVALAVLVAIIAIGLVLLFLAHRREVADESAREAPVVAASRVREDGGTAVVTLDTVELRRVGMQLATLVEARRDVEERLPAEVVPETERTALVRAPVAGRVTVPAGARWPRLGEGVAMGRVLAQVSDARPLSAPIGGVVSRVDAQPGALVEAGQPLLELADYSRPLVRVVWLGDAGRSPPSTLTISAGTEGPRVSARFVGPASEADPVTRRPAYLYRATRSWPGATPGTPASALVPHPTSGDTARGGALVPDAAVVQWEGLTWAYRARGGGRFERVRVPTDHPVTGGWVVGPPLAPGDSVVTRGAEELLSEEFRARVTVGDESGE